MGVFHHFLKILLVLKSIPFLLDPDPDPDPDPYCFCLDPDPYQSSPWIRIHNKFFHILDPDPNQNDTDPYQNDTNPPHCPCQQSSNGKKYLKV